MEAGKDRSKAWRKASRTGERRKSEFARSLTQGGRRPDVTLYWVFVATDHHRCILLAGRRIGTGGTTRWRASARRPRGGGDLPLVRVAYRAVHAHHDRPLPGWRAKLGGASLDRAPKGVVTPRLLGGAAAQSVARRPTGGAGGRSQRDSACGWPQLTHWRERPERGTANRLPLLWNRDDGRT